MQEVSSGAAGAHVWQLPRSKLRAQGCFSPWLGRGCCPEALATPELGCAWERRPRLSNRGRSDTFWWLGCTAVS